MKSAIRALISAMILTSAGCYPTCIIDDSNLQKNDDTVVHITCKNNVGEDTEIITKEYEKAGIRVCREKGYQAVDLYFDHPDVKFFPDKPIDDQNEPANYKEECHITEGIMATKEFLECNTPPYTPGCYWNETEFQVEPQVLKCKVTCTNEKPAKPYQLSIQ